MDQWTSSKHFSVVKMGYHLKFKLCDVTSVMGDLDAFDSFTDTEVYIQILGRHAHGVIWI